MTDDAPSLPAALSSIEDILAEPVISFSGSAPELDEECRLLSNASAFFNSDNSAPDSDAAYSGIVRDTADLCLWTERVRANASRIRDVLLAQGYERHAAVLRQKGRPDAELVFYSRDVEEDIQLFFDCDVGTTQRVPSHYRIPAEDFGDEDLDHDDALERSVARCYGNTRGKAAAHSLLFGSVNFSMPAVFYAVQSVYWKVDQHQFGVFMGKVWCAAAALCAVTAGVSYLWDFRNKLLFSNNAQSHGRQAFIDAVYPVDEPVCSAEDD